MKRNSKFELRLSKDEKDKLFVKAKEAGLETNVSEFIRRVVFRHKILSSVDVSVEMELIKLRADQARLGNLINQWLSSEYHHDLAFEFKMMGILKKTLEFLESNQISINEQLMKIQGDNDHGRSDDNL